MYHVLFDRELNQKDSRCYYSPSKQAAQWLVNFTTSPTGSFMEVLCPCTPVGYLKPNLLPVIWSFFFLNRSQLSWHNSLNLTPISCSLSPDLFEHSLGTHTFQLAKKYVDKVVTVRYYISMEGAGISRHTFAIVIVFYIYGHRRPSVPQGPECFQGSKLVALMRPTLKSLEAPKYLGTPEK
jgi:hypothetical protein